MQIYVKDDVGVTDLQVLTVQVTDVNEPPQFQGNLAQGETYQTVASERTLRDRVKQSKQRFPQKRQLPNKQGKMKFLPQHTQS